MTKPRYAYPPAAVRSFVAACAASAEQRPACVCTIERLQHTLPYPAFRSGDRAIRSGRPVPARTRRTIDEATGSCRDRG